MDRVFRTLGLGWRAKNDIAALPKKYVDRLDAFAYGTNNLKFLPIGSILILYYTIIGVNEFLKTEQLPLEFMLIGHKPKPFTAVDFAACGRSGTYNDILLIINILRKWTIWFLISHKTKNIFFSDFAPSLFNLYFYD
jgi:hypothetical protein